MRDNSHAFDLGLRYKPIRGFYIDISYLIAEKGTDYEDIRGDTSNYTVLGKSFMDSVVWEANTFSLCITYEIINDGYIFFEYMNSNIKGDIERYTSPFFHGRKNTYAIGMNYKF